MPVDRILSADKHRTSVQLPHPVLLTQNVARLPATQDASSLSLAARRYLQTRPGLFRVFGAIFDGHLAILRANAATLRAAGKGSARAHSVLTRALDLAEQPLGASQLNAVLTREAARLTGAERQQLFRLIRHLLKDQQEAMQQFFARWSESLAKNAAEDKKAALRSQREKAEQARVDRARAQAKAFQDRLEAGRVPPRAGGPLGPTAPLGMPRHGAVRRSSVAAGPAAPQQAEASPLDPTLDLFASPALPGRQPYSPGLLERPLPGAGVSITRGARGAVIGRGLRLISAY
jgi:hypothetical protein